MPATLVQVPVQIINQGATPRFFATAVPEPALWVLSVTGVAAGTLVLRGMRGRKGRKA